jgi:hypothetical protein
MVDINPRYMPRMSKTVPLVSADLNQPRVDKGKGRATTAQKAAANSERSILAFFGVFFFPQSSAATFDD